MNKKNKKEELPTFSIITLGNSGVGKTSILRRFSDNEFDENMLITLGMCFSYKNFILKMDKKFN